MNNVVVKLGFAALILSFGGCTPQAKSIADEIVQVSVDACSEIANFVPPADSGVGQVVGLACNVVGAVSGPVTTIIDSGVWNQLKTDYLKSHGSLPHGLQAPAAK